MFANQEIDNWNKTSPVGSYPNETWFVSLYFATNNTVDIQNFFNARPQILQLSASGYSGNYSATTMGCTPLSLNENTPRCYRQYDGGGEVKDPFAYAWPRGYYLELRYNVTLFIWRNSGVVSQLSASTTLIPGLFLIIYGLIGALVAQLVVFGYSIRRRKFFDLRLLDSAFFTISVGFLFFLPVYSLSLDPIGSPIPNISLESNINQLLLVDAIIVIVGLLMNIGIKLLKYGTQTKRVRPKLGFI